MLIEMDLPEGGFALESGERLKELVVAYETFGRAAETGDNAVCVCHALTGDAHVANCGSNDTDVPGWWDGMIGPGKGIDTNYYFVVCSNVLGGCAGTTGPSSINPDTGRPYGSSFPETSVTDMVRVQKLLMDRLGIRRLAAVIGGSFGGMQALEWSILYPEMVDRCICIATGASLSSQALAFDAVARDAIVSDPGWNGGDYYDGSAKPSWGLAHARKIGHITYLSPEIMQDRFGRQKEKRQYDKQIARHRFEVENYLEHQGRKLVNRFDANSYLRITEAMDAYDLVERFDTLAEAFSKTRSRYLVVALSSDWLFPPEQSVELANGILRAGKSVSYCTLHSPHGHDTFLVDVRHLNRLIRAFLPWVAGGLKNDEMTSEDEPAREYEIIAEMIPESSKVLDLGCGDGTLLSYLKKRKCASGTGADIDLDNIIKAINRGHDVFHGDIDSGLAVIPDASCDAAVLSNTLQALRNPALVLSEMLRAARKGIVSFPNFGKWPYRIRFALRGRIPVNHGLKCKWHDSPDSSPFTLRDFIDLCRETNIEITEMVSVPEGFISRILSRIGLRNLGADHIIAAVRAEKNGNDKL